MSGFVLVYRKLLGHPAFRNDAEALAFAWLILKASWKPTKVRYKGHIITLGRGELAVSIRDFARAMERNKDWCDRLIRRLKAETMAETRVETGVTVITICNYSEYQDIAPTGETPRKTRRANSLRQDRDTEQTKEQEEEIPPISPTAILDGWRPREFAVGTSCRKIVDSWNLEERDLQIERFVAHHQLKRTKSDNWQGFWKTWVLNSVQFAPAAQKSGSINRPGPRPYHEIVLAEAEAAKRISTSSPQREKVR